MLAQNNFWASLCKIHILVSDSTHYSGSYTRGALLEVANVQMPDELRLFACWRDALYDECIFDIEITEEKELDLYVRDFDSDAVFQNETLPLCFDEYCLLKSFALKYSDFFR